MLRLGLTFPTKWRRETRDRFARVAEALREQFARERKPRIVTVHRPEIDEANAVAIALLDSPEFPEGLGETFHIVAYDFGGGTIDTSVLEVSHDHADDILRTRYVGLGGLKDFGGDEVTRATMMLLRERIAEAFRGIPLELRGKPKGTRAWLDEVPLSDDVGDGHRQGIEQYLMGRENWAKLWQIAEQIKFALCDADAPKTDVVWPRLNPHLSQVECLVGSQGKDYDQDIGAEVDGPIRSEPLKLDAVFLAAGAARSAEIRGRLAFTLDDVYDYELDDIERSNNGRKSTIRGRVEETIREIEWQCGDSQPPVKAAIIVLAGGGCRLPLVRRLMEERFPGATIVHKPKIAKSRVSAWDGILSGLRNNVGDAYQTDAVGGRDPSPRRPEGVPHEAGQEANRGVHGDRPAGSAIDDAAASYPFDFRPRPPVMPGGTPQLDLFVHSAKLSTRLGPMAFDRPIGGEATPGMLAVALPQVDGATYRGTMTLLGDRGLRLVVELDGKTYGPYPIDLPGETLLELLQQ